MSDRSLSFTDGTRGKVTLTEIEDGLEVKAVHVATRNTFCGTLAREGPISIDKVVEAVDKGHATVDLSPENEQATFNLFNGLVSVPLDFVSPLTNSFDSPSAEMIAQVRELTQKVERLEKDLLSLIVGVPNRRTAELFHCRTCGLQPDLMSLLDRDRPSSPFGTYRVCWTCRESSWHRTQTKTQVQGISCPRCAKEKNFKHARRQGECIFWIPFPDPDQDEWLCACCAHAEPSSVVFQDTKMCSLCHKPMEDRQLNCTAHLGPVSDNKFLCCNLDFGAKECTNLHAHSRK